MARWYVEVPGYTGEVDRGIVVWSAVVVWGCVTQLPGSVQEVEDFDRFVCFSLSSVVCHVGSQAFSGDPPLVLA